MTKAELIDAVATSAGVSKADAERTLGAMFLVMSLPTVMIFKDGAAVDTLIGAQPKSEIVSRIHHHI